MKDNNQIEDEKIEEEISVEEDKCGGVILTVQKPMDYVYFASPLEDSISHWKQQGKKGMWINNLLILHSNIVDSAVKAGFSYHHAEPNYLMLVYRIPDTSVSIPANASHRVDIGAFVVNNKNEILKGTARRASVAVQCRRLAVNRWHHFTHRFLKNDDLSKQEAA
jgi:hypothetical protein